MNLLQEWEIPNNSRGQAFIELKCAGKSQTEICYQWKIRTSAVQKSVVDYTAKVNFTIWKYSDWLAKCSPKGGEWRENHHWTHFSLQINTTVSSATVNHILERRSYPEGL